MEPSRSETVLSNEVSRAESPGESEGTCGDEGIGLPKKLLPGDFIKLALGERCLAQTQPVWPMKHGEVIEPVILQGSPRSFLGVNRLSDAVHNFRCRFVAETQRSLPVPPCVQARYIGCGDRVRPSDVLCLSSRPLRTLQTRLTWRFQTLRSPDGSMNMVYL